MGDSVPVRCPACLNTQPYAAPAFPCPCGNPVAPTVAVGVPAEPITRRSWTDEWVTVRCGACGREDDWPHPELGCRCGTLLRVPVEPAGVSSAGTGDAGVPAGPGAQETGPGTPGNAVAAAAGHLRRLGFRNVVRPEERPVSGVDLRAPGLVAQVDSGTRPTGLRAVECLWLNGLSTSAVSVFFSLAGYTPEARSRAAEVGLPLFALDPTGTARPVNDAARELAAGGA